MKHWKSTFALAAILAVSTPALAIDASDSASEPKNMRNESIWLGSHGNFASWRPVARDEVILWASPARPYLVKIWRPFTSLKFAHSIRVTTTAGRVTKFDTVIVDGQRLPIKSIIALDRETAKGMRY